MKIAPKKLHNPSGLLAVTIILILLISCSSNNKHAIIGEWAEVNGDKRIEASKKNVFDGFDYWVVFVDGDTTFQGPCKLVGKDKIQLNFVSMSFPGGTGSLVEAVKGEATISEDELTLKMPDGDVSKFKRMKQQN